VLTDAFLPAGSVGRALPPGGYQEPLTETQRNLADILADLLGAEQVSVHSNFFDDLGADSLMMAQFCARVRKRPDLPTVSIKDVYQHPTISSLTAALASADTALPSIKESVPEPAEVPTPSIEAPARASSLEYVLCGTLQVLIFLGYSYLVAAVLVPGYVWISDGSGVIEDYLRSVLVGGGAGPLR